MKRFFLLFLLSLSTYAIAARETVDFNDGWTFALVTPGEERAKGVTNVEDADALKIGDTVVEEKLGETQNVRLPHDWGIVGPFDTNPDTWGGQGKLPWRGVGWYSKKFTLSECEAAGRTVFAFGGCMAFPEVYINGKYAGGWDYGYQSFEVDATPFVRVGENVIQVRCDTRKHGSRWYPGAGIYRPVRKIQCGRDAWLPDGSATITTSEISAEKATVEMTVKPAGKTDELTCYVELQDAEGTLVAKGMANVENGTFYTRLEVLKPQLWSPDSPYLYTVSVAISRSNSENMLDELRIPVGLRTVEWTANDGFHLNGKRLQLYGVDLHHDQGILGAAAHPDAIKRQLRIMKDMGVNAIRTSHNPASPEFMDACDQLGFIVWDELFDKWNNTADLLDQRFFAAFMERQVKRFIDRDKNRPSVCVWSIGNEIWDVESNQKGSSNPDGDAVWRVKKMVDLFHQYDPTRKTGLGCFVETAVTPENPVLDPLDVSGWNYGAKYLPARKKYPNMPLLYTESASAVSTRGYYELPHPTKKDTYNAETFQVDGYDLVSASGPRDIPDVDFDRMERDSYVAGEFVWTGFDYLGEPTPFDRNARSSYFGIVDLCGLPKDRFWLYRSYWNHDVVTVHILPHWNWEGKQTRVPVYVYTNGDTAELFLNGRSLGKKRKFVEPSKTCDLGAYYAVVDKYRLRWEDVTYEPGTLEAVAYKDGKEIGRSVVKTAGEPAKLRMTPETKTFADDDSLCYVLVEAVDQHGTPCPWDSRQITAMVEGPAELVGIDAGNPMCFETIPDAVQSLFYGKAMIVLRSRPGEGTVKLHVSAEGLGETNIGF